MNLTDCDRTSLPDVVRRADELAAPAGVRVVETELVGLAPRRILPAGGAAALRLPGLSERQILESHLQDLADCSGVPGPAGTVSPL